MQIVNNACQQLFVQSALIHIFYIIMVADLLLLHVTLLALQLRNYWKSELLLDETLSGLLVF